MPFNVVREADEVFARGRGAHDRDHWVRCPMTHKDRECEIGIGALSLGRGGIMQISG